MMLAPDSATRRSSSSERFTASLSRSERQAWTSAMSSSCTPASTFMMFSSPPSGEGAVSV